MNAHQTRSIIVGSLLLLAIGVLLPITSRTLCAAESAVTRPNVILCMTDDQGWADVGYNDHPVLKTPHLDAMAAEGIRFQRFYAGAPVCSPTRGSCLTGRHPYRYGIPFANAGHMLREEVTLAEVLKTHGYVTGHFGKWHLGTLTTKLRDSNRGRPGDKTHYSPPWVNGFDVCFSTEAKVPTFDPMKQPSADQRSSDQPYGTHYFNTDGSIETENLAGDDSRVIMDRAVPFLRATARSGKPLFMVVWFHTPHLPTVAGPRHRAMYEGVDGADPDYHGCITAMDEQVGRLRKELSELGVADNTMLWFCSDNGPEGKAGKAPGSAGPLRGRKRDLFEGGIRVPGILVWPAVIRKPRTVDMPCSTVDYFPTVLDVLGLKMPDKPQPVDGVSLLPLIEGKMTQRPRPIGFESRGQVALVDNRYKLIRSGKRDWMLFDLVADPGEKTDLAREKPKIVQRMSETLGQWRESCRRSAAGEDY